MGHAIDFPQRNGFYGKPEELSNNQCYALPVCHIITAIPGVIPSAPNQNTLAFVSVWKLTDEEVEQIIKDRCVYLRVLGTTLFPVSVSGVNPINKDHDKIFTREEIDEIRGYKQPEGLVDMNDL